MRSKNGCNGNFHLIKSFLLAVFCSCCPCCPCCFFVVFPLLFFLFVFWRSVFLLRVFSQVCLFFLVACVFWQHPICCLFCVCTLSWALVFSLCLPSSLPCSSSFSLFLTPNYTYSPRRVCPVYLYWTFPELQLPKKKPQVCGWRCGRGREREGGCVGVCAALLMLWK